MNRILLLLALIACYEASYSQWVSNPSLNNHITRTAYEDNLIESISDGANGAIFICADGLNNGNIYLQKINHLGQVQWNNIVTPAALVITNDRKLSITAIGDGTGGAFIAWSDYRNNQFNGEIYVQRFNSSGNALWTAGGVRVTNSNANDDFFPVINVDGAGGLFVGWQANNDNANYLQSFVQRYNSAGTVQWTANGVLLSSAPGFRTISSLLKDGSGGVFAIFDDTRNDPNGLDYDYVINNTLANIDIYGQHISGTGTILWTNNALVMANGAGNQSELKAGMVEDGSGGFMFAYSDGRNDDGSFNNLDVFAQRINSNGAHQWAGGAPVTIAPLNQSLFKTIADGAGGLAVALYEEFNGACGAQKMTNAGLPVWAANGVTVSPVDEFVFAIDMLTDIGGNLLIALNTASGNSIIGQKLDAATGMQVWGTAGKIVCNRAGSQASALSVVISDNGSMIVGWTDYRYSANLEPPDAFCSKLLSDGTVAGFPVYITVANGTWENPASWTGNIVPNHGVPVIVRHSTTATSNIICGTMEVESPGHISMHPTARLLLLK